MDIETARRIMAKKRKTTSRQKLGIANARVARMATGRKNFEAILQASREGKTIQEAAEIAGMTVGGVKNNLIRNFGSSTWPVKEQGR